MTKYSIFPLRDYDAEKDEEVLSFPVIFRSYVLAISAKTFRGNIRDLGIEIARLGKELNAGSLIFLGDTVTPWLYQNNDYTPVQKAQLYLSDLNIGKRFNGGIEVEITELPVFIKHLSWLVRCNTALPYIYFIDPGQNIVGNICQYGNLHISTLNKDTDNCLNSFIKKSKLLIGNEESCNRRFGQSGAIEGRKTVI